MSLPTTRQALEDAGYKRSNYSRCQGCRVPIEWWITPSGARMPWDHMPYPESAAVSHWATCTTVDKFRKKKEPRPCKPEDLQMQLLSSTPPKPSVKNTEDESDNNSETN